mgnify:CR=1 FL=1|jgi:hypothetical protein
MIQTQQPGWITVALCMVIFLGDISLSDTAQVPVEAIPVCHEGISEFFSNVWPPMPKDFPYVSDAQCSGYSTLIIRISSNNPINRPTHPPY